jgi:hypothetical protein
MEMDTSSFLMIATGVLLIVLIAYRMMRRRP